MRDVLCPSVLLICNAPCNCRGSFCGIGVNYPIHFGLQCFCASLGEPVLWFYILSAGACPAFCLTQMQSHLLEFWLLMNLAGSGRFKQVLMDYLLPISTPKKGFIRLPVSIPSAVLCLAPQFHAWFPFRCSQLAAASS